MATEKNDEMATRRGFLTTLLGGLAGTAGLLAAGWKPASAESGGDAARGKAAPAPIDNIFTPLRPARRKARQGGV